jgi:CubicO group peptidase (beta-lactamase class C family)
MQSATALKASVPSSTVYAMTPQTVEAFINGFASYALESYEVPGLGFVMVKDGEVFFSKGYGFADEEMQVPFDPDQTIVRGGSIVKTVTALAVMQLVEQGKLDLDADVNQYLSHFQVPQTYDKPVTARHLLHYTAGFDTRFIGIRVESMDEVLPLGEYLAHHLTARVRPPGEIRSYNDFEIALAGLLVEEVSGMPYDQFVQEHVFKPLGMESTSIYLSKEDGGRVASGYRSDGQPYPLNYYYLNDAAGAGFNTTVSDLARYMIMHLENGKYGDVQLLNKGSANELHTTRFQHDPHLPGIAYTFDEMYWGGLRVLAKSGGAPGFQNRMLLIPDLGVGIYFVQNRDSNVRLVSELEQEFQQRFFPSSNNQLLQKEIPVTNRHELDRYAGYYVEMIDYSEGSIEKVRSLMDQGTVTVDEQGRLKLHGSTLQRVDDNLFQWNNTGNYVAFREDDKGRVTHMFYARTALLRVPWYETFPVQMGLLGFALVTFLTALIGWPAAVLRRQGKVYRVSGSLSLLNVAFLVGLGLLLTPVFAGVDPPWVFSFAPPPELLVLLALPLIGVVLTLSLAWQVFRSWKEKRGGWFVRVHNTLVLMAGFAFLFFLHTWNLLGYRL